MRSCAIFILVVFFAIPGICTTPIMATPTRCSGGVGGVPFSIIPGNETTDWRLLSSVGFIEEITVLDDRATLFYRNSEGHVFEKSLHSSCDRDLLSNIFSPISRVLDPRGNFLINEGTSSSLWGYDRIQNWLAPIAFPTPNQRVQPLFWKTHHLYSASVTGASGHVGTEGYTIEIFRSDLRSHTSKLMCSLKTDATFGKPTMAFGSEFPNGIFSISVKPAAGKPTLGLLSFDVESCVAHIVAGGPELESSVRQVYYFPSSRGYAAMLDGQDESFIWWDDVGCGYLNTEGYKILVPNVRSPTLIGWNQKTGLSKFDIAGLTRQSIATGLRPTRLMESRIGITDNKLILAAEFGGDYHQSLIEVDLSK